MVALTYIGQLVVNGLLLGGLYALLAVGLTLIYGVLHILNLSHGAFIVLGSFIGFWGWKLLGINPYIMVIPTFLILFILALPIKKMLFDPIQDEELLNQLLLTFGLTLFIEAIMSIFWGTDFRLIGSNFLIGNMTIPGLELRLVYNRLGAFGGSIILFGLLYTFLYQTKIGRAVRATADSQETASVVGVDIDRIESLVFGLGIGLAGASGVFLITVVSLNPYSGTQYVLLSFVIVAIGGMGSVFGSLIGGLLIGIIESVATIWISSTEATALVFVILLVVFLMKPRGIFGRTEEGLIDG